MTVAENLAGVPIQAPHMIPYEIPLRLATPRSLPVRARIIIPADLTMAEADRLCATIRSIAFPDETS